MKKTITYTILLLFMVVSPLTFISPAIAQNLHNATETSYRDEIARIRTLEGAGHVEQDLVDAERWLELAVQLQNQGKREQSQQLFRRVRIALERADIVLGQKKLEVAVAEQKKLLETMPTKIKQLEQEIAELKKEKEKLEKDIAAVSQSS